MDTSEESIIAKLRAGDSAALAQFIELRRPQLMSYIERQLGSALRRKVEPDDIFQDTSAEAVRSLVGAAVNERDPFGWLCQIAERKIIDLHRKFFDAQKRDAGREVPLAAPSGGSDSQNGGLINMLVASMTTPTQAFSRNAREASLMEALQALPEDQRDALRLRYIENLPSKQIAERLGKSDAAIRVMLTRSLKKLQDLLGEENAPRRV
jgi:RNA polymerase sigma-70 factor (ECF subfamily)